MIPPIDLKALFFSKKRGQKQVFMTRISWGDDRLKIANWTKGLWIKKSLLCIDGNVFPDGFQKFVHFGDFQNQKVQGLHFDKPAAENQPMMHHFFSHDIRLWDEKKLLKFNLNQRINFKIDMICFIDQMEGTGFPIISIPETISIGLRHVKIG